MEVESRNGDGARGTGPRGNLEVTAGFAFDAGEELGSVGLIVTVVADGANTVSLRFPNSPFRNPISPIHSSGLKTNPLRSLG